MLVTEAVTPAREVKGQVTTHGHIASTLQYRSVVSPTIIQNSTVLLPTVVQYSTKSYSCITHNHTVQYSRITHGHRVPGEVDQRSPTAMK